MVGFGNKAVVAGSEGVSHFARLILAFTAGYCDTLTFLHMGGVFCAHVTGNFVLFAASLARGLRSEDYLKIATFPVFVLGVVVATVLVHRAKRRGGSWLKMLLWLVTALMMLAGVGSFSGSFEIDVAVTLLLVFALGMQNTLHHFAPGPMTTVMTGTVMNTTAGLTEKYLIRKYDDCSPPAVGPGIGMGAFFLVGCTLGALGAVTIGFKCLLLPALLMVALALKTR